MYSVVLIIHLILAVAICVVVLLQRSEGGGLGMGGGGVMGGVMTSRGAANVLTRTTAILAACFMVTSMTLAIMSGRGSGEGSIIEEVSQVPAANQAVEQTGGQTTNSENPDQAETPAPPTVPAAE
jgi:preprotein translocase subunit SecG